MCSNFVTSSTIYFIYQIHQYSIFDGIKTENPKHVSHKHLKLDVEEDRSFLKDIALLNEVAAKVSIKIQHWIEFCECKKLHIKWNKITLSNIQIDEGIVKEDFVPDVYWFRVSSLHPLSDLHGPNSTETIEAKQLLQEAISRLTNAFVKQYNNHVFISVVTSDAVHTRLRRNILATEEGTPDVSGVM